MMLLRRRARASIPPATATAPPMKRSPGRRCSTAQAATMVFFVALTVYFLLPVIWLLFAATKSTADLSGTFGLWFGKFNLVDNLGGLIERDNGLFARWMANSAIYAGLGGLGATFIAALAGYALAEYRFRGREAVFWLILGGVLIPYTVLALPLFLLESKLGLIDTYWAVLLPSLVSPFGVYLSRVYAAASVPDELLEAARIDGAGELRIFLTVALRIMSPALATVLLFQFVGIWNNFLLPLVVLNDNDLFPVTLGLFTWNRQIVHAPDLQRLVVTGSAVSVIPLAIAFFTLQRYWRAGLTAGAVR